MKLSPKAEALFHLVIVPIIFVSLLMFSGNIISVAGSWLNFQEVFFYSLILVFVINKKFLFRLYNTPTIQYFKVLDYNDVITERIILEKIRKISLVVIFILLTITIIHVYSEDSQNRKDSHTIDLTTLFLFSTLFISAVTFSNCYYKIHIQDSKKHFRLFLASGYFKNALNVDDDLKTKIIGNGLIWLNRHYKKKNHLHIENLDKINLKIIDENSKNKNETIKNISEALESGVENSALDIIAVLMNTKTLDLLVKDSIFTTIKELNIQIGALIGTIAGIILIWQTLVKMQLL